MLEVVFPQDGGGYMIVERSQSTLRLIEIIGNDNARIELWREGLGYAAAHSLKRVRGWEALARDLAPGFSLTSLLPDPILRHRFEPLRSFEREWGMPMFLAINDEVAAWTHEFPCPLLELDHF
jgi:hypothetical protein